MNVRTSWTTSTVIGVSSRNICVWYNTLYCIAKVVPLFPTQPNKDSDDLVLPKTKYLDQNKQKE